MTLFFQSTCCHADKVPHLSTIEADGDVISFQWKSSKIPGKIKIFIRLCYRGKCYGLLAYFHLHHELWNQQSSRKVNTNFDLNQTSVQFIYGSRFHLYLLYIVRHLQSALSTGWQMACLFPSLQCLFQTWLWQHVKPTWWSSMTQQFSCAPCPRARPCLMFGWKAALWSQQVEECSSAMEEPPSLLPWWPAMTRGRLSAMCPTVSAMKSAPLYIWTSAVSFHKTTYQPTALTKSSHTTS